MSERRQPRVNVGALVVGLVLVGILVAILGSGFGNNPREVPSVLEGKPAPDFTLADLDGKPASLSSHRGKTVVLNFWSTWCLPCKQEHPLLQAMARTRKDVQFYGVIYSDEPAKARRYLEKVGSSYPTLIDPGNRTAIDYGVAGVPETFVIGPDGDIRHKFVGPLTAGQLSRLLEN